MKPPRLSRAQWELLRKCPDANTGQRLRPYGPEVNTARSLAAKGLVYLPEHCCWRTPAGRALLEAEDKRIAEEAERVSEADRRNFEQTALAGSWEID